MNGGLLGMVLLAGLSLPLFAAQESTGYRVPVDADGVQRVRLRGGSYYFTPDHLVVKVGVPVELLVSKEPGLVPHSLVIWSPRAGLDVDVALESREQAVRFTPRATGRVTFYCKEKLLFFTSHKDKGMTGILDVVN